MSPPPLFLFLCLLFLLMTPDVVNATIYVSVPPNNNNNNSNESSSSAPETTEPQILNYPSMPALFGLSWKPPEQPHLAVLHVLNPDKPLLCPEEYEEDGEDEGYKFEMSDYDLDGDIDEADISQTLSIALLAKRGNCTFYQKSILASKFAPYVQYLIIYDNEINDLLVTMSSEPPKQDPPNPNLGLLFISYRSGIELRDMILEQQQQLNNSTTTTNATSSSKSSNTINKGILIKMDGIMPQNQATHHSLTVGGYFLAAFTGLMTFFIVVGLLFLLSRLGIIPRRYFDDIFYDTSARRRGIGSNGSSQPTEEKKLLTKEQVLMLDIEVYNESDDSDNDYEEETKKEEDKSSSSSAPPKNENDEEDIEAPPAADPTKEEEGGDDDDEDYGDIKRCCAICLDNFDDGEITRKLPCCHNFHDECLIPWLTQRQANCPLCKYDIMEYIEEEEKKLQKKNKRNKKKNRQRGHNNDDMKSDDDDDDDDNEDDDAGDDDFEDVDLEEQQTAAETSPPTATSSGVVVSNDSNNNNGRDDDDDDSNGSSSDNDDVDDQDSSDDDQDDDDDNRTDNNNANNNMVRRTKRLLFNNRQNNNNNSNTGGSTSTAAASIPNGQDDEGDDDKNGEEEVTTTTSDIEVQEEGRGQTQEVETTTEAGESPPSTNRVQ